MPFQLDYFNKLILITSPTVVATVQALADFIEDEMASPVGLVSDGINWDFRGDVARPEGKLEDAGNPGVFTQIILQINPDWQIQFFAGSGYTRIRGGKVIGGLANEVMKATGTAGDITVLETQVDGTVVVSGSGLSGEQDTKLTRIHALLDVISGSFDHAEVLAEIWQRLGLDNANPLKTHDDNKIEIGPDGAPIIVIEAVNDATSTTQTRTP